MPGNFFSVDKNKKSEPKTPAEILAILKDKFYEHIKDAEELCDEKDKGFINKLNKPDDFDTNLKQIKTDLNNFKKHTSERDAENKDELLYLLNEASGCIKDYENIKNYKYKQNENPPPAP